MTRLNKRFALEASTITEGFNVIDLYKSEKIGMFWPAGYDGIWIFKLDDGRSRFGGYAKVMKSLKLMLRAA